MQFRVLSIDSTNKVATLRVEAVTRDAAIAMVAQRGLTALRAVPDYSGWWKRSSGDQFSALVFSRQLIALLGAGLTITEALRALAAESQEGVRQVLEGLRKNLDEGKSLSEAVAQASGQFPSLYVALIRASERTGDLKEALGRYVGFAESMARVRAKVVSATIYPACVVLAGVLVSLFLILFVVPRLAGALDNTRGQLPFFSMALSAAGRFIADHQALLLVALTAVLAGAVVTVRRVGIRELMIHGCRLSPRLSTLTKLFELARLYRGMGMLLKSGIPAVSAVEIMRELVSLSVRESLDKAAGRVRAGESISTSFADCELTTPIAASMLAVGDRTGAMGEMMERVADFLDDELSQWIDRATRLFEPLLMVMIGCLVGGIVVLMYMPIFELATSIQ